MPADDRPDPAGHPEATRRQRLRISPSTPALTYYDENAPARVELSAITLDNWVAKAANLLSLDLEVTAGEVVALDLAGSWLQPVWAAASWGIGAIVALPGSKAAGSARVRIVSADRFQGLGPDEAEVEALVCSNHPLGAPLGDACPAGAIDALAELPGQPDVATLLPPDPSAAILATGSELLSATAAMRRAAALAPTPCDRIAVTPRDSAEADFFAVVLVPLALAASTVLIVNADPTRMAAIALAERAEFLPD